jgi:hypothetical protein
MQIEAVQDGFVGRGVIVEPSLARMLGAAPKEYGTHFRRVQVPNDAVSGIYN